MFTLSAVDPNQAYGYGVVAPQGAIGNFLGGIAPSLGTFVGGAFGNQGLGGAIGQGASPFLRLLPFQADPMAAAYGGGLAPQGAFGNWLGGMAPAIGGMVGGAFGNQAFGHAVGQAASPFIRVLPFQTDPTVASFGTAPAMRPQPVLMPQDVQDPELQVASNFLQDAGGAVIKRLHEYLQTNLPKYGALADAIPLVQRAAELYEARDYPNAYAQAYQAYRGIGLVRTKQPDLPSV